MNNIRYDIIEIEKINLAPGDVLVVKLIGDAFDDADLSNDKKVLQNFFPDNRILMIQVPSGASVEFAEIKKIVDNEFKEISAPQVGSVPCSDCSCGKKESLG